MRHAKRAKRMGGSTAHRVTIIKNLVIQLVKHDKIMTTELRAKEMRSLTDKVVGLGKRGDLHAKRQAIALLGDEDVVARLFGELSAKYKERPGGYTRITKIGPRLGDSAEMVQIELV